MKFMYALNTKLASATLIGLARVAEAVAQHPLSLLQSRKDLLVNVLGAVGKHKGQFCHRRKSRGARIQQDSPQAVSQGRTSRLAGDDYIHTLLAQVSCQLLQLGGLAGAVEALKGYKLAAWFGRHEKDLITFVI